MDIIKKLVKTIKKQQELNSCIIHGTGQLSEKLYNIYKNDGQHNKICNYADNDPSQVGKLKNGVRVLNPEQAIKKMQTVYICSQWAPAILNQYDNAEISLLPLLRQPKNETKENEINQACSLIKDNKSKKFFRCYWIPHQWQKNKSI